MSYREYVVTCKSIDELASLYDDIETVGGTVSVPDRAVPVYRRRAMSQNTHYMLTDEEANLLRNDARVKNVMPAEFLRLTKKLHAIKPESVEQTAIFSKSLYSSTLINTYRNWGLLRCIEGIQRSGWGSDGTPNQTATINYGPTGQNVDVIIVDGISGKPNHPEFAKNADGTGGSRYVQYNWYLLNSLVASIDDTSPVLLSDNYPYTGSPDSGNANHGTHTAGTVAGNTQGWARDANIYQISPLGDVGGIDGLVIWDYIRLFHKYKPINPATGRRNPTICNCSYGSSVTAPLSSSISSVIEAQVSGHTYGRASNFTPLTSAQLNKAGMYNTSPGGTVTTDVPYYDDAEAADIALALADGIIIVSSSGNESYYVDSPTSTNGINDYFKVFLNGDHSSLYKIPSHSGTSPSAVPGVICVGATDATSVDKKGWYSNTGPRIDVWAPGTWIISSFADSSGNGWGATVVDSRNSSYYIGRDVGTSMASPQVTGVLACLLELYPSMTPAQALSYIQYYGTTSQVAEHGTAFDVSATDWTAWTTDQLNLQGAPNRHLYFPIERPVTGEAWPKKNYMPRPISGRTYPRVRVKIKG